MTPRRPHDPYAALRVRDFRWFVVSMLAMTAGAQIQATVVGWQIYALTRDPLALGLIGLTEALPFIGVALFAGHAADRRDRRTMALSALGLLCLCSAGFLVLTAAPGLVRAGHVWPLYLVVFATGFGRSWLQPARQALGAELVPRELYANAIAWRSSIWQFASVTGPALGGLLYGWAGVVAAYAVAGTLMTLAVAALALVRPRPPRPPADGAAREPMLRSLLGGIRFVRGSPIVLAALSLDMFSVFFGGAVALLPVFAAEILHVGPQGLGMLRAAPAAGSVLMSLVVAHRPPFRRAGRALLTAVAVFGVCTIGFGLSRSFPLSLALLLVAGMADNVSVVIRSTLVQTLTPEALLGRVSAVNSIFIGSSNEIGAFESGVAARLLGVQPAVVFGGVATLVVVLVTARLAPALRRLREIGT